MNGKLRCDFPTPMTKTRPPVLVASVKEERKKIEVRWSGRDLERQNRNSQQAVPIELSTPVHSIEIDG